MPYNPGVSDQSGRFLFEGIAGLGRGVGKGMELWGRRRERDREKEKSDAELMQGFKKLWENSPPLQEALPDVDWGEWNPNMVKGVVSGLALLADKEKATRAHRERRALGYVAGDLKGPGSEAGRRYLEAGGGDPSTLQTVSGLGAGPWEAKPESVGGVAGIYTSPRQWRPVSEMSGTPRSTGAKPMKPQTAAVEFRKLMEADLGGARRSETLRTYLDRVYGGASRPKPGQRPLPEFERLLTEANRLSMIAWGKPFFLREGERADHYLVSAAAREAAADAGVSGAPATGAEAADALFSEMDAMFGE